MLTSLDARDRHLRQEAEANEFAIELLTPRKLLKSVLRRVPDLADVVALSDRFDVSKEAAARRYVRCHQENLAVVFCRDGFFRYADRGADFPLLSLRAGKVCYRQVEYEGSLSDFEEAVPEDWLISPTKGINLSAQSLWQEGGRSMTLLRVVLPDEDEQCNLDDAYDRFDRFR
jgi:hypothetical protein